MSPCVKIPAQLGPSLAAYLRQAELSLHRANSITELREFLIDRSVRPKVVRDALTWLVKPMPVPAPVNWDTVQRHAHSLPYFLQARGRTLLPWVNEIALQANDFAAILESLGDLETIVFESRGFSPVAKHELRFRLCLCSGLVSRHVRQRKAQDRIHRVEHLNSAAHLDTLPIRQFPEFPWEPQTVHP